tara:strand:+ start:29 stop:1858 length:1830 start_codon:yes stop_codon:yes gene_type:complete
MSTTIKSTQLDFDTIKSKLKEYLKQQTEFADYDFEASGLSNILDVLAYNTHFTGLNANFALNESFINTAQLRSSVAALAEGLGYVPRSYVSSEASLNLALSSIPTPRPNAIILPRNTQFTTSVDGVSYTFQTREAFTANDDGNGTYQFLNSTDGTGIPVFEGTEKTKTFFVGDTSDTQIYVIPDVTMDTTTIRVRVFPTAASTLFDTYTDIKKAVRIENDSTYYQIKEVPNGFYELIFGDGLTTGKAPIAGNKIIVDYLSTQGSVANTASSFSPSSTVTINSVAYNITVVTEANSAGGAFKENIESIRQNAPIAFTSQRRLVTAEDYKGQILSNFSAYLDDVTSYGGADNVPAIFGVVFVGLKFKAGITDSTQVSIKNQIKTDLTDNMSVMSITTEFVDPITTNLQLSTTFNLDPDLTSSTGQAMQNLVQTRINSFFGTNLQKFNKVFRRSNLLTIIDALDPAILNSKIDVKMVQTFIPTNNISLGYDIIFPVKLSVPASDLPVLTSSGFTFNGQSCSFQNKLSSNKIQIVSIDGTIENDNVGTYNQDTGTVSLVGFKPSSIDGSFISIVVTPANQNTIRPLRNYVLDIDTSTSTSRALLDFQNTRVSI